MIEEHACSIKSVCNMRVIVLDIKIIVEGTADLLENLINSRRQVTPAVYSKMIFLKYLFETFYEENIMLPCLIRLF